MSLFKSSFSYCFIAAMSLHLALAFAFTKNTVSDGAVANGEGGITIGLGMIGDYVDSAEVLSTPEEEAAEPPKNPAPQEEVESPKVDQQALAIESTDELNVEKEPDLILKKIEQAKPKPKDPKLTPPSKTKKEIMASQALTERTTDNTAENLTENDISVKPASKASRKGTGKGSSKSAGGRKGEIQGYFAEITAWLQQHKTYPIELKKAKKQGTVTIKFSLAKSGEILTARVQKSSGVVALDDEALLLIKSAQLPPFPSSLDREQISLSIPVEYSLRTK